ncbi:MAG: hypothetical protein Q7U84_03870, partial [Polynucleobacter sp.]|nr:hypothetical protein [Polynucleobacter sp.]
PFAACATGWNGWGLNRQIEMKKPEPQATCLLDQVISNYKDRRQCHLPRLRTARQTVFAMRFGAKQQKTRNPLLDAGFGYFMMLGETY